MSASGTSGAELSTRELRDLRRLAAIMIPADAGYGVPGADDETIFADIVRSLGRDAQAVRTALAMLRELAGEEMDTFFNSVTYPAYFLLIKAMIDHRAYTVQSPVRPVLANIAACYFWCWEYGSGNCFFMIFSNIRYTIYYACNIVITEQSP